ncbi:uncharacterized protein LOC124123947 [Haliotis rufescens]|uniref:uncharacterized protein LOC124123947 n=1 Tax=Haliotis rufescens TaxID=6454 RepID=UPI00201EF660|nr:uncharacterized protein LOC124123947 [Haliotis rufescens]
MQDGIMRQTKMSGRQRQTRSRSTSSVGAKVTSFFRSLVKTHNDEDGAHTLTELGDRAIDLYRQLHRDSGISAPERSSPRHEGQHGRKGPRRKCGNLRGQRKTDVQGFSKDESEIPGSDTFPTRTTSRKKRRSDMVPSEVTVVGDDTILQHPVCVEPKKLSKSTRSGSSSPNTQEKHAIGPGSMARRSKARDRNSKIHCSPGNVAQLNKDCIRNEINNRQRNILASVPLCMWTSGSETEAEEGSSGPGCMGTQGKARWQTCIARISDAKDSKGNLPTTPCRIAERRNATMHIEHDGHGSHGEILSIPSLPYPDPLAGLEDLLQDLEVTEEAWRKRRVHKRRREVTNSAEDHEMGLQQGKYGTAQPDGDTPASALEKVRITESNQGVSAQVAMDTRAGTVMDRAARRAEQEELSREMDALLALIGST